SLVRLWTAAARQEHLPAVHRLDRARCRRDSRRDAVRLRVLVRLAFPRGGNAMKRSAAAVVLFALAIPCIAQTPPEWAYPVNPPGFKPKADDGTPHRVEGSSATYTLTQLRDRFISPVWHSAEHPAQPEVVARGRKPDVFACGFCHRADGPGGPENANLMGLPPKYIAQQMADYKSGARKTAVSGRNIDLMISLAKAATDAEIQAAAAYFSAMRPRAVI